MGKRKVNSKTKFVALILVFALVAISCATILTFAWFTDRKDYSSNLSFGAVELEVSGKSVKSDTKTLEFDVTRTNGTYTGKIMPGDTVNIALNIGLTANSEDAYYIVQISDEKNIFENAYYYSQNGTDVYVNNGTTIVKQGTTTAVTTPVVGKLLKGTTGHNITIGAKISEDFEEKGISTTIECNVYAIQVANLSEAQAFDKLVAEITKGVNFISNWKSAISNASSFSTIGFYKTGSQPSTVTLNEDLTSAYNNKVTLDADKNLIKVYTNGTTELAFVSDYIIYAPESCASIFAMFSKLTTLNLSNFNTSKVTNMNSMFAMCDKITSLIISNFDTSKVTSMNYMFYECTSLTTLNNIKFDTSNVTNMQQMFNCCRVLTALDLTSFDTSKVTNMNSMFDECPSLTTLNISSKFTNKGTAFTKATLCSATSLPTSVAVYRDGVVLA